MLTPPYSLLLTPLYSIVPLPCYPTALLLYSTRYVALIVGGYMFITISLILFLCLHHLNPTPNPPYTFPCPSLPYCLATPLYKVSGVDCLRIFLELATDGSIKDALNEFGPLSGRAQSNSPVKLSQSNIPVKSPCQISQSNIPVKSPCQIS